MLTLNLTGNREYQTYTPDTTCVLPEGGGNFSYVDPLLLCPLCDPNGWGGFMNQDLFPELNIGPISVAQSKEN